MKRAQILLTDWAISRVKINDILSRELGLVGFSISNLLKKQLRIKDDLTEEMFEVMNKGQLISTELIDRLIHKNLIGVEDELLFVDYPRTLNQFLGLKKILPKEGYNLEQIWYFKIKNPNQYIINEIQSKGEKLWIERYGDKAMEKWKTAFIENANEILTIQKQSDSKLWRIIPSELDFESSIDELKSIIKSY